MVSFDIGIHFEFDQEQAEELFLDKSGLNEEEIESHIKNKESKELINLLIKEFDRIKMHLNPHHWKAILKWKEK